MDIIKATKAYEAWLGERIPLLDADLRLKHQRMAHSPFPFLRATFYRWVQLWPRVCPDLANAPAVLGVGDLHVDNFGTWRDSEGRLIWGVNDFDEAAPMPYTNDLVRLAVSAMLAVREHHLRCDPTDACDAILSSYREAVGQGGTPFVLAEQHGWLRNVAVSVLRPPALYWQNFNGLPTVQTGLPAAVKAALKRALPEAHLPFRVVHRQAGLGSLGRRRFAALTEWRGGWIAREAKELVVSAWHWESGGTAEILYQPAIGQAVRVPDPFVEVKGHWLIRRLAADCSRIELGSLPKTRDEMKLLHAMGWETANIHLGTKAAVGRVLKDLSQRPGKWLRPAAEAMAKATLEDWKGWTRA
jgi:Uncharacterized protein conserved in bacteria (DUF2252)